MFVALPTIVQAMLLQYLSSRPHAEVDGFVQMLKSCPPGTPQQQGQQQPAPPPPADGPTQQPPNSASM